MEVSSAISDFQHVQIKRIYVQKVSHHENEETRVASVSDQ